MDFDKLKLEKIKFDCRYYSGYKPCGYSEYCDGCEHYSSQGTRILIIKLAAMGDVLRTTSILPGLKKKYNPSYITWVTDKESTDLLKENPLIDRLFAFNTENLLVLVSERFDLLLNYEKENRALALAGLVNAIKKKGFAPTEFGTLSVFNPESLYALQLGISDELKFEINKKSYPEIIYEMSGLAYGGEEYVLNLGSRSIGFAEEFARKHNLSSYQHIIGVNTGCGSVFESKQWTLEGFAGLINALAEYENVRCLLLGGEKEREFNGKILKECRGRVVDTGCNNTIEEFLGIVSNCELVVTADSLAMHIAIGLKKKVVAFFGPTSPAEIDLFGRGKKIIPDFPCLCCYKRTCPREISCLQSLDSEVVFKSVVRQLGLEQKNRTL